MTLHGFQVRSGCGQRFRVAGSIFALQETFLDSITVRSPFGQRVCVVYNAFALRAPYFKSRATFLHRGQSFSHSGQRFCVAGNHFAPRAALLHSIAFKCPNSMPRAAHRAAPSRVVELWREGGAIEARCGRGNRLWVGERGPAAGIGERHQRQPGSKVARILDLERLSGASPCDRLEPAGSIHR